MQVNERCLPATAGASNHQAVTVMAYQSSADADEPPIKTGDET